MTPEQTLVVIEAAKAHQRFQAAREARHEAVRRSHRVTAHVGGGEQECARRRRQCDARRSRWVRWAVGNLQVTEVPQ